MILKGQSTPWILVNIQIQTRKSRRKFNVSVYFVLQLIEMWITRSKLVV